MRHQYLAVLTAAVTLMLGAQTKAAEIVVGNASGNAGATVEFEVTLNTQGEQVAGTQNDIAFDANARIKAKDDGSPDCDINTAIMKPQSTFAFQPSGCTGTACTGIRSLVLAFSNVAAIPDGSRLYTCQVAIAEGTTGTLPLTCSNPGASDPDGGALTSTCTNGEVVVGGEVPTTTPTTPPVLGTNIVVGSATGQIGEAVDIDVTLETDDPIAGTQNDITFSGGLGAAISIRAKEDGTPDCTVNPVINKPQSTFAFQPSGCEGEECTGIRSLVLAFSNVAAIPTGSLLYRCKVTINDTAQNGESYPLTCSNAGASDPDGGAIEASCSNGSVTVGGGGEGTPTASPTATTSGVVGTPTATPPAGGTPTRTPTGGGIATPFTTCDDSCAITSPADAQTGWLLLLPAAMLIWLRRRSR